MLYKALICKSQGYDCIGIKMYSRPNVRIMSGIDERVAVVC